MAGNHVQLPAWATEHKFELFSSNKKRHTEKMQQMHQRF